MDSGELFKSLVRDNLSLVDSCLSSKTPHPEAVNDFSKLCLATKALLLKSVSSKIRGPRWFDDKCSSANRHLREVLLAEPRCNSEVKAARRNYKEAINNRKGALLNERWEILSQAATNKQGKVFWSAVRDLRVTEQLLTPISCSISSESWENHFSKMFAPFRISMDQYEPGPFTGILISLPEVEEAINQSIGNKAPGPDGLPIDLIKWNPNFWAPLLLNVFNNLKFAPLPKT